MGLRGDQPCGVNQKGTVTRAGKTMHPSFKPIPSKASVLGPGWELSLSPSCNPVGERDLDFIPS